MPLGVQPDADATFSQEILMSRFWRVMYIQLIHGHAVGQRGRLGARDAVTRPRSTEKFVKAFSALNSLSPNWRLSIQEKDVITSWRRTDDIKGSKATNQEGAVSNGPHTSILCVTTVNSGHHMTWYKYWEHAERNKYLIHGIVHCRF